MLKDIPTIPENAFPNQTLVVVATTGGRQGSTTPLINQIVNRCQPLIILNHYEPLINSRQPLDQPSAIELAIDHSRSWSTIDY